MKFQALTLALSLAALGWGAEPPLPELKTEATDGGSRFRVKNTTQIPLMAFLIELVEYPGSSYILATDEINRTPVMPGAEKVITVSNMTAGAVPDYMKLTAAIYADGTTAGPPQKVARLLERRRTELSVTRDILTRLQKPGATKVTAAADLRQAAEAVPVPSKATQYTLAGANQIITKSLLLDVAARLDTGTLDDLIPGLRAAEKALAESQPALN